MKKKAFFQFIITNSLVLIIALLANWFGFYSYQKDTSFRTQMHNQIYVSQIQQNFDEKMRSLHSVTESIYTDPSVRSLLSRTVATDIYSRYTSSEVMSKLRGFVSSYDYVDSIIIVYPNLIVTDSSVYHSHGEFITLSNNMYWTEESWNELLSDVGYIKYSRVEPEEREPRLYSIVKPINLGSANAFPCYSIINFRNDIFQEHIGDIIDLQRGLMYITDRGDNLIMSQGDSSLLEGILGTEPEAISPAPVSIQGRNYMLYHSFSNGVNLKYGFILPVEGFFSKSINRFIVILFVGVLLFGLIMNWIISLYNANPIMKISKMIAQRAAPPESVGSKNELEYIRRTVEMVIKERSEIQDELVRHTPILQAAMISNILKGMLASHGEISGELESIGIEFPCEWFSVMILEYRGDNSKTLMEYNIINVQLRRQIEDHFSEGTVYICDVSAGMIACLLNLPYSVENKKTETRSVMEGLIRHLHETCGTMTTITSSGSAKDFSGIPMLYAEAASAMDRQLFHAPGQFTFHGEAQFEGVILSAAELNYLTVNLKAGNGENVRASLDRIANEIHREPSVSPDYVKYIYVDLIRLLQKTISDLRMELPPQGHKQDEYNPIKAIIRGKNADGMKKIVTDLYEAALAEINSQPDNMSVSLADNIKGYIDKHGDDPDLSLNMVADRFNLNASYLSSYFKKNTGENFANYVNRLRLKEGCRLLKESDMQIGDIAVKVGYSNSGIFINNFKKVFGITPGVYRNSERENSQTPDA